MADDFITPISDGLSKPLERLFRVGGFALAFGFAGLLLMVFAGMSKRHLSLPVFVAGFLLTFICLAFFVYSNIKAMKATRILKEDLPLLDALQNTAYQISEVAALTQSLAFKHLQKIKLAVDAVAPYIENVPFIGDAAKKAGLTSSVNISTVIVTLTDSTKNTVLSLQSSIREGNLKDIQKYGKQLELTLKELRAALQSDTDV
jgi:hypothetical protein